MIISYYVYILFKVITSVGSRPSRHSPDRFSIYSFLHRAYNFTHILFSFFKLGAGPCSMSRWTSSSSANPILGSCAIVVSTGLSLCKCCVLNSFSIFIISGLVLWSYTLIYQFVTILMPRRNCWVECDI